jgi:dTDP-4-dehydrorhamnose reductase
MKVLLLGEKGYLGSYLYEHLKVDILNTREIYDNGKHYDYVINCIGKPDLEYCELNREETDYSNRDILLDLRKYYPKSKIINFSSYYVYDDTSLCTEDSNVTYQSNYTRQKLEGEKLIENGVSFRVGKLFGHPSLGKQKKLTEHIITNDDLFLDNVLFNPTSLNQVLKVIEWELENSKLFGIFNLANRGVVSHYEYGVFITSLLKDTKKVTKVDKIVRQFNNYGNFTMSCSKLEKYINLADWKTDMVDYLKKYYETK